MPSEYHVLVRGSRGECTRTGSRNSGMRVMLTARGAPPLLVELFPGWMGSNLRLAIGDIMLYEAALEKLPAIITPHSEYRKVCPTIVDYRNALRHYADGLRDNGQMASRILDRRNTNARSTT